MKRLIIAVVCLAVILGAVILEHINIDKTFNEFSSRTDELNGYIMESNTEAALNSCTELLKWWEKKRVSVESFSYSPDTRQISVILGEIEGSLKAGDLLNAESKVVSLEYLVANIQHTLDFNAL